MRLGVEWLICIETEQIQINALTQLFLVILTGFTLKWPWKSSHGNTMETPVHTWHLRLVDRWNRKYCNRKSPIQMPRFYILWQLWHGFTLKWPSESSHVSTMETLVHTWYLRLVERWSRNYCKGKNTIQLPIFHNLWQLWHGFTLKWPWSHQITTHLETL